MPTAATIRLKPTVEPFLASDGQLYLLRGGDRAEFVVADPTAAEIALVRRLAGGPAANARALRSDLQAGGHDVNPAQLTEALDGLAAHGLLETDGDSLDGLSSTERERYGRQMLYFGDQPHPDRASAGDCQRRLKEARVLVIGVGGLGSWVLSALACAGVGSLVGVDFDDVELSNLNRQLLFDESDIGHPKVHAAARALRRFNPEIAFEAQVARLRSVGDVAARLDDVDLVVCAADLPMYQIGRWVNQACVEAGVPWISGGQFPPLVRIGPLYAPGVTGCLQCQEDAARAAYPFYDELAAFREANATPGATLGASTAMVGAALAMNIIHALTGVCAPGVQGRALILDLRDLATRWEAIERLPDCPVCVDR